MGLFCSSSITEALPGYDGEMVNTLTANGSGYIAKSDTRPITFYQGAEGSVLDADGLPIPREDITGWLLYIAFYSGETCAAIDLVLEVVISPQDALEGIFSGNISDDDTFLLPVGEIYVSMFTINAAGQKQIQDMAQIEITPCGSDRREQ